MLNTKVLSMTPIIQYPGIKILGSIPKGAQPASLQEDVVLRLYEKMCATKTPNQSDPNGEHDLDISVRWSWNPQVLLHRLFGGLGDISLLETIGRQIVEGGNQPVLSCEFVKVGDQYFKCKPNPDTLSMKREQTKTTHTVDLFSGNIRVLRITHHKSGKDMHLQLTMSHLYADATAGFKQVAQMAVSYNIINILSHLLTSVETVLTHNYQLNGNSGNSFSSIILPWLWLGVGA